MIGIEGWGRRGTGLGMVAMLGAVAFGAPASAAGTLDYGSRAGMEVDIVSAAGLDTDHAIIHTRHTRDNAIAFCRDYVGTVTPKCIREALAEPLNDTVSANCTTGRFTTPTGGRYRYAGRARATSLIAKYRIIDLSTGAAADGTSASGYSTNMVIFRALCPHHAPADE